MEKLMQEYPESDGLEWNRDNDNFEVLRHSDILISDFSGVIFEYALIFNKPVIYADTSFDRSPYDACWTDGELWTFTTLEKIGRQLTADNIENIKELIDTVMRDGSHMEAIENARKETWAYRGKSVEVITDYLINKRAEILETALKNQQTEEENKNKKKKFWKKKEKEKVTEEENTSSEAEKTAE